MSWDVRLELELIKDRAWIPLHNLYLDAGRELRAEGLHYVCRWYPQVISMGPYHHLCFWHCESLTQKEGSYHATLDEEMFLLLLKRGKGAFIKDQYMSRGERSLGYKTKEEALLELINARETYLERRAAEEDGAGTDP